MKIFLIASSIGCILIILGANQFGESIASLVGNLLYIPIAGSFVIVSFLVSLRFGLKGTYGKAWIFFLFFAICWFTAEMIWAIFDLVLEITLYPSIADFFWLAGYPFIFIFMILYIKPFKKSISKNHVLASIIIPIGLVVLTTYFALTEDNSDFFLFLLTISYPILDSLILIPGIIGIILFLKGQVNLLWVLISIGIIFDALADIGFFITQNNFSYFTGHPIEIFFYLAYIFYTFGAYNHLKIFRSSDTRGGI